ncbi:MAG: TIGR00341 family protein [Cyanobacteria bacterium J06554_11]
MAEKNKTNQSLDQSAYRYGGYVGPSRARCEYDETFCASTDHAFTDSLPANPAETPKLKPKPKHDRPQPRRLRLLALLRNYCPQSIHRPIVRFVRRLNKQLAVNGGDWQWMANNPLPLKSLNRNLWRSADPSFNYYVMLFLSGVISALGLLAGSTAAIIGAMIVAPLMGPITAMAFAITMANRRLLKRSVLSVVTGALLTIGTAYFICSLVGLNTLNPEILARTRPTLIDLVIGLAAGAAGSFAKTRKEVADALPGVAIAVALVPPLSVIGIGLAYTNQPVVVGATLLFLTNLSGIILSGGLVFIWQDYGSIRRAKRGLTASTLLLLLLTFPLGLSMRELIIEERARSYVGSLIRRQTETFSSTNIRRLRVNSEGRRLLVDLEVAAPAGSISENQVGLVREFLEEKLGRPIELEVKVFPVEAFSAQ